MTKKEKKINLFLMGMFLVASFFIFFGNSVQAASENEIKEDIKSYEKKLEEAQKTLTNLQTQSSKNKLQISTTQSLIQTLQADIIRREKELKNLNDRAVFNKEILSEYLRQMYYAEQDNEFILLADPNEKLNQLTRNFDDMTNLKSKIVDVLAQIDAEKNKNEAIKSQLVDQKETKQDILEDQKAQQAEITSDVQEAQLTVAQIQQKISKLRSTLSSFLGKSYNIDDVVDAVKLAEKKTGVRKEFIFAMLDKETDLGRFTGGCFYSKGSNSVKKHMKEADKSIFLDLMDELGYGENEKKLSCWPGYGYGGAMGIAQFMPSTWTGYKSNIASLTGNKPADPWRLEDGVIGMALKLKKAGATSKSKEHYAAKVYYCGGSSSPYWNTKCKAYADTVISWSKGYDEYF